MHNNRSPRPLILASASTTRQQLLENAGLSFAVEPSDVDERRFDHLFKSKGNVAHARALASAKARQISQSHPGSLVIGADQTLTHQGALLHKVSDLQQARLRLQSLRGQTHILTSALALARDGDIIWDHAESAGMSMNEFSDQELDEVIHLEGEELLFSVGCYRLEGPSIRLFKSISGDYFSILGLPLLPLLRALRQFGGLPENDSETGR